VGREIEVPQSEPGGVRVEHPELLGGAERLVAASPPSLPVERITEPVRDRIQVRTHPEAVHVDVVARVPDHRDVGWRHRSDEPAQELPRADASRERDDLHEHRA
jgi:hypothetical protein